MIGSVPKKFLDLKAPKMLSILSREFPDIDVEDAVNRYLDWIAKNNANPGRYKPVAYFRKWLKEDQDELREPRKIKSLKIKDLRNL